MKLRSGVRYQIRALQAVAAQLLDGGTTHHARGFSAAKRGDEEGQRANCSATQRSGRSSGSGCSSTRSARLAPDCSP
eukprot:181281-Pyramimonas_sp.AAC.1